MRLRFRSGARAAPAVCALALAAGCAETTCVGTLSPAAPATVP